MTTMADIAARMRQPPSGRVLPASAAGPQVHGHAAGLVLRPIWLGEMQARLLRRLEQGPALKTDLVAAAYAGRRMPRYPESTVSVYLHRLAGLGFPLFISLGSGHVHLAPGGPAWMEKAVSRSNAVSRGTPVSPETKVPRETGLDRDTHGLSGSAALVEAVLRRQGQKQRAGAA